ncbi:MAG: enoyl-CoA hydratase/isomerase family protein [Caulobacteraceae bacterium]|nr:enoyl-CoA hydratase/isomerase family protein [Caulobacteraceae bacterium]
MSGHETIVYEKRHHVATIALNRPQARNGIVPKMMDELWEAVQDAAADEQLRVLVLRGVGRDFCPGADVKAYAAGQGPTRPETFNVSVLLHETPMVTIAAIRGACAGAGFGWASACDLRICDETARFNTAFLDVAMSGDMGGSWFLSRILGGAKARELYFLPGKFDAAEAARIGLVNKVTSEADFEAELTALADRLANASPLALKGMKANFVDSERMGLADFIAAETARHTACGRSEDSREAFRAFVEKRRPVFQGR